MSIRFGPEWRDIEQRLASYPRVSEANLRRAMTASLLLIEGDARRRAPQDTRRLSGSITHEIRGTYPQLVGQVGPSVTYGVVMEFGRDPLRRMPPVAALMPWVRRRFNPSGSPNVRAGRSRNAAWGRASQRELRSLAFVVARSIGRKGIRARPYLRPAYEDNRRAIDALFARIGARVVAYLAGGPAL